MVTTQYSFNVFDESIVVNRLFQRPPLTVHLKARLRTVANVRWVRTNCCRCQPCAYQMPSESVPNGEMSTGNAPNVSSDNWALDCLKCPSGAYRPVQMSGGKHRMSSVSWARNDCFKCLVGTYRMFQKSARNVSNVPSVSWVRNDCFKCPSGA
jgi:hypothetical protein